MRPKLLLAALTVAVLAGAAVVALDTSEAPPATTVPGLAAPRLDPSASTLTAAADGVLLRLRGSGPAQTRLFQVPNGWTLRWRSDGPAGQFFRVALAYDGPAGTDPVVRAVEPGEGELPDRDGGILRVRVTEAHGPYEVSVAGPGG